MRNWEPLAEGQPGFLVLPFPGPLIVPREAPNQPKEDSPSKHSPERHKRKKKEKKRSRSGASKRAPSSVTDSVLQAGNPEEAKALPEDATPEVGSESKFKVKEEVEETPEVGSHPGCIEVEDKGKVSSSVKRKAKEVETEDKCRIGGSSGSRPSSSGVPRRPQEDKKNGEGNDLLQQPPGRWTLRSKTPERRT